MSKALSNLINDIESDGVFVEEYSVDENQVNSNCGDAVLYYYDGVKYEGQISHFRPEPEHFGLFEVMFVQIVDNIQKEFDAIEL